MTQGTQFSWAVLGKADYSQAAALVASLPEPIRKQMTGHGKEILCRIVFLCWKYSGTSGRGKAYCVPSERYLAKCIVRSDRTVRRCLVALARLGLVQWKRRKSNQNVWATNLYEMGKSFLASLYARHGQKLQRNHQRTFLADNDLKKGIEAEPVTPRSSFIESLLAKRRHPASADPLTGASPEPQEVEDDAKRLAERKAFLRNQWLQLQKDGVR